MKATSASRHFPRVITALTALLLGACAREDEVLQRQLVETRAALAAKTKALEEAEAAKTSAAPPPAADPAPTAEMTAELSKAKGRIAELEQQLAAARESAATPAAPRKLDLDALKDKLENDLTLKAKTLRELLLRQAGVAHIDEIGIKGIDYPPEIIAPFRSAITFALSASDGRQLRLVFPVTADLDGSWSLPGPDKVQQAYRQVKDAPAVAASEPESPSAAAPAAPAGSNPAAAPVATTPRTAGTGFRQVDANTYQFDWGDGAKGARPTAPPLPQNPSPAAPVAAAPQPTATPSPRPAPAPAAQPEVTVPKPVMPVQRDIIIKF